MKKSGNRVVNSGLAEPRLMQCPLLAIQKPFHNSFNDFTHRNSYSFFLVYHRSVDNFRDWFSITKAVNPSFISRDSPRPYDNYWQLKSLVKKPSRDGIVSCFACCRPCPCLSRPTRTQHGKHDTTRHEVLLGTYTAAVFCRHQGTFCSYF